MVIGTDFKEVVQGLSEFYEGVAYKPPCSTLTQIIVEGAINYGSLDSPLAPSDCL